jgi:dihydropteroate synthase
MSKFWQTARRKLFLGEKSLVMGIVNLTPDSFYDGGRLRSEKDALRYIEDIVSQGADILDVGGESTRPKSARVPVEEEIRRIVPVIEIASREFGVPISVDTSRSSVAEAAVEAGAEIINDVSGLRFDDKMAATAARLGSGLVLMHSRGPFELLHRLEPVKNILPEVVTTLRSSIDAAVAAGVEVANIVLDIGFGFGKTGSQNLELIAKLDKLVGEFKEFPILVGASRKSTLGKVLNDAPAEERLYGSLGVAAVAVYLGAKIIRAHDVKATKDLILVVDAIKRQL